MCSLIGFISVPAVLLGGWLADAMTRRLGPRWGRSLPMALPRFVAAGLYFTVALLSLAWLQPGVRRKLARACADPMSQSWTLVMLLRLHRVLQRPDITVDLGLQHGRRRKALRTSARLGKHVGQPRAQFASPTILILAVEAYGWTSVFWICGGVFFAIAALSLFVDATDTVDV